MTNYNERLDDLTSFMESIGWEFDENGYTFDDNYINFRTANILRQNITSLIKELVEEAKPAIPVATSWQQGIEKKAFEDTIRVYKYKLLKALEEV